MSSIQKMSIQGMRSFGPEDADKQILSFFTPLTLILGPNGSGKTTIIECLKYITTGDMPPNSGRGQSFIHDPKLAHEMEVRGQVKLQLKDVLNQTVCSTRSILLTQKQKKVELKTLDGTVMRVGPNGKKNSLTTRCADINKEMITCLGVSKPILNNVIFCHQEESNWPLSEGKALKQKFDEIFAATRYIKALDNIKKIRQEQAIEIRVGGEQIKCLFKLKEQADKIKAKLSEKETYLASSKDRVKKIKESLQPIEQKLQFIQEKEFEIDKMSTEIVKRQSRYNEMEKNQQHLQSSIENLFDGTIAELEAAIKEFKKQMTDSEHSIKQLEQDMNRTNAECEKIANEKSELLVYIGKLKTEDEQHKEKIRKRNEAAAHLSKEYNLDDRLQNSTEFSQFQAEHVIDLLNGKVISIQDEMKHDKANFAEKESKIQSKIDALRDSRSKLEHTIKIKSEQIRKNEMETRQISSEINKITVASKRLSSVQEELWKAQDDLQKIEVAFSSADARKEIENLKSQRETLEANFRKLDGELQRIQLQSRTQTELDLVREELKTKNDTIKKLLNKHDDTINHLLGHSVMENFRYQLDNFKRNLRNDMLKLSDKRQNLQMELSSAESKRRMLMDQLKTKENELKTQEERLFDICGDDDFDTELSNLEKNIKLLQDENGSLMGTKFVYLKFIQRLQKKTERSNIKICCPLCSRDFEDDQDVIDLINDLNTKMVMIPSQIEGKSKSVAEQQKKLNSMIELRPVKTQMEAVSQKDIPNLKKTIKTLAEQIDKCKKEISEVDEQLEVKKIDESTAEHIQGDMVSLDQAHGEVRKLEKKRATFESKLSGTDSSRTMTQINQEKENIQQQGDNVKKELENLQDKLADHIAQQQTKQKKVNLLLTEKSNLESQLQNQTRLQQKKMELAVDVEECNKIIQKSTDDLDPLEAKIDTFVCDKEKLIKARDAVMKTFQEKLDVLRIKLRDLKQMNNKIDQYLKEGKGSLLITNNGKLQEMDRSLSKKEEAKSRISSQMDQIRKELHRAEVRERELSDNYQLSKREEEMKEIKREIDRIKEDLGGYDKQSMIKEKRKLQEQIDQLLNERSQAEGRQREVETSVRQLKADLQNEDYKEADENYKNKLVDFKIIEVVSSDLQKYYLALDSAIMKHHSLKMTEINKIVRELWRNTYRGTDIDYIEIRSDEEDGAARSNMRKTYNYRVVMVKGEVIQDMRGRCSAGQKVLASIIIRLALAETFGLNCGILALDEPTTNLDRENIEGLAESLVDIVKSRQKQRNFQLVVITHDEDFLERLGRSEFVDHYYKVSKNHRGLSCIQKFATSETPI